MEFLKSLDAVQVQAWVALLILIIGLFEAAMRKREKLKTLKERDKKAFYWATLRELAPKAMLVVEKAVRLTPGEKDDQFLEVMIRMAKAAGIDIFSKDHTAIKDFGTAAKEKMKIDQPPQYSIGELTKTETEVRF